MRSAILSLSIGLLFFWSCLPEKRTQQDAHSQTEKAPDQQDYVFYPGFPQKPKYQFLTSFASSRDVEKGNSRFMDFVLGEDRKKPNIIGKAYGVEIYDGVIFVCDMERGVVAKLDLKRKSFDTMGEAGLGKLVKPVNLKIEKNSRTVYVADIGRRQVVVFDLDGTYLRAFGTRDQFYPSDVDVFSNNLFVCDVRGHYIHVLDKYTGNPLYKIGGPGSQEGELFHPTNILIKKGRLYISDTSNYRVQVMNLKGEVLGKFGEIGREPGRFARNKGIAVDDDGRIYVVDAAFENVQVFNSDFKLLLFMLGPYQGPGSVSMPAGVAVDYDNLQYFKQYVSPKFSPEYLLFVTSNFGENKVNVYAFGEYTE